MIKTRSFLKWAGSKYHCIQEVVRALPEGQRLIEPFTGSGVIFLNTHYPKYLMAENNNDLFDIFNCLKQQGESFINYCEQHFRPETNCKEHYYESRLLFNRLSPSHQKSALFLYLNRHGYNGLCRYNSKGGYNVPFGLYSKPYFPQKEMILFSQKSQQAQFFHQDFRTSFALAEKGDVIYCDPPYVPLLPHLQTFAYTQKKFSSEDHIELAELARETACKGIPVIISNHDTDFTRHHYQDAVIRSFLVPRWISCDQKSREPVRELIAIFH